MPNFLGIFSRKVAKTAPITKKVNELTPEERAEIEDQTAAGIPAREIADSLRLDVESVYSYRRIINKQKQESTTQTTKDILSSKMQEREILKADYELEKLKLDLEKKRQEMTMDRITFERDMREWREKLGVKEGDELSQWLPIIEKAIPFLLGKPNINNSPNTANSPPAPAAGNPEIPPPAADPEIKEDPNAQPPDAKDLTDDEIRNILKGFDKKQRSIAKLLPDTILFDKIADYFPTVSDQSINRAISLLRAEF